MEIEKMKFEKENTDSKARIILKKSIFSLLIFVFETFIPLLTGFEMIVSMFLNYFIINCMWLSGFKDAAEKAGSSLITAAIGGAVFVVLLHLFYHVLIDGIFNTGLLIEMNFEIYAVFLFFTITDKFKDNIMSVSRYMFLAASCFYSFVLIVYFAVKFLKKIHIKYKKL